LKSAIGKRQFGPADLTVDGAADVIGLRIAGMFFDHLGQRGEIGLRGREFRVFLLGERRIADRGAAGQCACGQDQDRVRRRELRAAPS
jgi:hypothetical protein